MIGAIFMKLGRAPAIKSILFIVCLDQHEYTPAWRTAPIQGKQQQ
jgi:hypothetical protein